METGTRCGSCRHWKAEPDPDQGGYGFCERIPKWKQYDKMDANVVQHDEDYNATFRDEKAATSDASGYFSALRCRGDFGCVLYEPAGGES